MKWLEDGVSYNAWINKYQNNGGHELYDSLKNDLVIMATLNEHFGGTGIRNRFIDSYNSGHTELFRKELVKLMDISEIAVDETLMIGSDEDTVKKIDNCAGLIADKFNQNRRE